MEPSSAFFAAAGEMIRQRAIEVSVDNLWDIVCRLSKNMPESARDYLGPSIGQSFMAQMRTTNRRGVLFVGPSGAGKTRLVDRIVGRDLSSGSTVQYDKTPTRLGSQIVIMRDTVGSLSQYDFNIATIDNMLTGPSVLVLVMANGFLDTQDMGLLERPDWSSSPTYLEYLEYCKEEERRWIMSVLNGNHPHPERKADAFVLVANKVDQWISNSDSVRSKYLAEGHAPVSIEPMTSSDDQSLAELIEQFKQRYVKAGRITHYVEVCSEHCKFRHATDPNEGLPANSFTGKDAEDGLTAFRAGLEYLIENC